MKCQFSVQLPLNLGIFVCICVCTQNLSNTTRIRMLKTEGERKTHVSATASVLMTIILWRMCDLWCWRCRYWHWIRCTTTLFHAYWSSSSHIIGKSTPWVPYYRHPINHYDSFRLSSFFVSHEQIKTISIYTWLNNWSADGSYFQMMTEKCTLFHSQREWKIELVNFLTMSSFAYSFH